MHAYTVDEIDGNLSLTAKVFFYSLPMMMLMLILVSLMYIFFADAVGLRHFLRLLMLFRGQFYQHFFAKEIIRMSFAQLFSNYVLAF